jgi:hypothetical protein
MLKEKLSLIFSDIIEQKVVPPSQQEYAKNKVLEFYRATGAFKCAFLTTDMSVSMACASRYSKLIYRDLDHELIRLFFSEQLAVQKIKSPLTTLYKKKSLFFNCIHI